MVEDGAPPRVPVEAGAMRWPIRIDRIECGECSCVLPLPPLTALTEIADVLSGHAHDCRIFL